MLVSTLAMNHIPAQAASSFWMPAPNSTFAPEVDWLFMFIFWLSTFFFVLIVALGVYFALKYRRIGTTEVVVPSPSHNTALEATWSLIPSLLIFLIFGWGFVGFVDMRTPPENAYEVQVSAKKWGWNFTYPGGMQDSDLHLPLDQDVLLTMTSEDVIHSLFIPAFRAKMDVVPGRYNKLWFHPTQVGENNLFCTEYCGTGHSNMNRKAIVYEAGGVEKKLEEMLVQMESMDPVELGKLQYIKSGCVQCHSVDGSKKVGPSFLGSFGTTRDLANGEKCLVDENYLRESILEPMAKVAAGYNPQMPSFKGQLREKQLEGLIAYIKSLKK
jgi:cytochrome c oxidase subunit 2